MVALNGTQGEVGVSLKKKKKFFRETHFHSVTTQMQTVVTLSDNLLPLHSVSPSIKWSLIQAFVQDEGHYWSKPEA